MFGFRGSAHDRKTTPRYEIASQSNFFTELEPRSDTSEPKPNQTHKKRQLFQKWMQIAILVFISIGLAVTHGYNCYLFSTWGPVDEASLSAFKSFSKTFPDYIAALDKPWRPRIFANYLAGLIFPTHLNRHTFGETVGLWNASWLFFCFIAYIYWDARKAIYFIFGTFACLYYSFSIMTDRHIYPWDIPALFFYIFLCIMSDKKDPWAVFLVAVIGTGFKETVALGSLVFLAWTDRSLRQRLTYTVATIAGCGLVKVAIDLVTQNPSIGFTMTFEAGGPLAAVGVTDKGLLYNLKAISMVYLNHPIFTNGGTFIIFLLLPMINTEEKVFKVIGIIFLIGQLLSSNINEYRIFHEMIPMSLLVIQNHLRLFGNAKIHGPVSGNSIGQADNHRSSET